MSDDRGSGDASRPALPGGIGAVTYLDEAAVPLVGLGASAGGVEALSDFFGAMPGSSGLAFLVVLHLDPTQASHLASILGRRTAIPVREIEDGMRVEPDHVYVIPPDRDLRVDGNTLQLREPAERRGHRHPIDVLFTSMAAQRRTRAAAIVLSGTGTNGTQGLKEVRAAGGLVLVQDPAGLRFDGMPRSAIDAGLADHVLAVADMPGALLSYFQHRYVTEPDGLLQALGDGRPELEQVLGVLRAHSGLDFQSYRPATLLRRVNRRMGLMGLRDLGEYLNRLRTDAPEVQALVRDLLISVTGFFRDPDAWSALADSVIAPLVAVRDNGSAIRVWVPACATGEEAYSIAMLLSEQAEAERKRFDLKIFASDLLERNLDTGRAGVYPGSSVETMDPSRISRFFDKLDGSYQVRSRLRESMVFARQDLLHEPPFSRMDLICCRNMLIYVEPEAQRRAISLFHFALREGGRLFLGSAETIGRADDLFEPISKKWRIYRRLGPTRHDIINFPVLGSNLTVRSRSDAVSIAQPSARATEVARRVLLDRFAPAAVLIDHRGHVLYFHGDTSSYLRQPAGEPTRDLLAMARNGLVARLRGALRTVAEGGGELSFLASIEDADELRPVRVTLVPLPATQHSSALVLLTFEPEAAGPAAVRPTLAIADGERGLPALEQELRATRKELQGTIEQLEGLNEELKAANEEATSMNEELQSTNEELETSKEELQSFNEELHSINSQLQHKVAELDRTSNDLSNLLSGTEIATLFLDVDLRIKWFSPMTQQLLALQAGDIGRPVSHFAPMFTDDRLLGDAQKVLGTLMMLEAEIRSDAGRWYLRRILPYRTHDSRIAGLVITFIDIHDRKSASDEVNEARIYAEAIVHTARQPLVVIGPDLRVRSANRAARNLFWRSEDDVRGKPIYEIDVGRAEVAELRRLLEEVLPDSEKFEDVEIAFGPPGIGQRTLMFNGRRLERNGGREPLILLSAEDLTEHRKATAHQEMLLGELNHRVKNVLMTVLAIMNQTVRGNVTLDGFAEAFRARLRALAQAHNLLVEKDWVGAEIGQLVASVLAPYQSGHTAQIQLDGSRISVRPQTGVALMMILHELATNAAKYGALSVSGGKLEVGWHRLAEGGNESLVVQWIETGGPAVASPSRRGFGMKLIEESTVYELGGEARLEYAAEGVRCDLIFPLERTDGAVGPVLSDKPNEAV